MRRTTLAEIVRDQDLVTLTRTATTLEAARLMSTREINSVLVMDGDKLAGIFTAHDVARRVIGADLSLDTLLEDVMTPDPETIEATESPIKALYRIFECGFRHLPVVADGKVIGLVSRRDLYLEEKELTDP